MPPAPAAAPPPRSIIIPTGSDVVSGSRWKRGGGVHGRTGWIGSGTGRGSERDANGPPSSGCSASGSGIGAGVRSTISPTVVAGRGAVSTTAGWLGGGAMTGAGFGSTTTPAVVAGRDGVSTTSGCSAETPTMSVTQAVAPSKIARPGRPARKWGTITRSMIRWLAERWPGESRPSPRMISLFRSARATKRRMPSFRAPLPSRQWLKRAVAKRRWGSPAVVGMMTTIMSAFVVSRIDWVSRSSFVRSAAESVPVSSTTWALGRPPRTTAGTWAEAEGAEMTAKRATAIAATRRMTSLTIGGAHTRGGLPHP